MKKLSAVLLGLCAPFLTSLGANGKGLLGERYLSVDGGWERLEIGTADNGWGVGGEINLPIPMDSIHYGSDGNLRVDYADVLDRKITNIEGMLRGYMLPEPDGFTPFIGVGIAWADFDEADTSYLPLEGGFEFPLGPLAVVPFYRYLYTFSGTVDDFWSAGVRSAYWLNDTWGLTGSIIYTDYNSLNSDDTSGTGLSVRIGLAVSF